MSDVYPHDRVVLSGRELRPPRYYDGIFDVADPEGMEDVKFRRLQRALSGSDDCSPARLSMRERHQLLRFEKLKRGYEHEQGFCG